MGLKSGFKKLSKTLFNFRPDLWLDYQNLKSHTNYFYNQFRSLYHIQPVSKSETFEAMEHRLQLTPEILASQKKQNTFLLYFYLCLFFCIVCYCFWLIWLGNLMGSCMSFAVALYALSFAFRYHFWNFQIEKRNLSCSFQDWLSDFIRYPRTQFIQKTTGIILNLSRLIKGKWA